MAKNMVPTLPTLLLFLLKSPQRYPRIIVITEKMTAQTAGLGSNFSVKTFKAFMSIVFMSEFDFK